jgi:hypothetical protein
MYNKTLSELRDIAKQVAQEQGVSFANVFDPMLETMAKAKAKYGANYHLCGGDGFHPDVNGHLVMAYAFLKGLGCDGDIGTIRVDLAGNKAMATEGHKVLSADKGTVEIESTRYPFCFSGDPKSTGATRGVIEFLPFNEELNRFKLVVSGAPSGKVKVTWGQASKEYTSEQLAAGINLAAEFLDNPFSGPFKQVEDQIRKQQAFETPLVKDILNKLPRFKEFAPNESDAIDRIAAGAIEKNKTLIEASVSAVKPVKHTLKIEPVQ